MFSCIEDIERASREELVEYLESWGYACYGDEEMTDLREAAIDNFEIEEQ